MLVLSCFAGGLGKSRRSGGSGTVRFSDSYAAKLSDSYAAKLGDSYAVKLGDSDTATSAAAW